ncbi:GtrA family protein [Arvimicrobium flavum]|uniref:GtrA family protein n=1 Tax=Arvimicrobium flavum TaxID=3393320 RepID=UPI00237A4E2F|nr:GtrA family protein [Mesorhizobium shangrilense]
MRRIAAFLFTGGIGFLADAGALTLILSLSPLDPFLARILSIAFALAVTWMLNRTLTWGPSDRPAPIEGARYGGVGVATSAINYATYSALLLAVPDMPPLAALATASLVAMCFSYLGYSRFVFDRLQGPGRRH